MANTQPSVLIVDDDEQLCEVLSGLLGSRGLRVLRAGTLQRASELAASETLALLALDDTLPDGSGLDWLEARRAEGKDVPVLLLTGFWQDLEQTRERINALKIARVFRKPFNFNHFADCAERVLKGLAPDLPEPSTENDSGKLRAGSLDMTLGYEQTRVPARPTMPIAQLIGSAAVPSLADPNDPLIGTMVGSFRIVRKIGQGGMGVVYLGEHPVIGSRVAIKFIHDSVASNPEAVTRFFAEARVTNMVGHESIVSIIDLSELRGRSYIIMEYLEGQTLAALLRDGPLDEKKAIPILLQVCAALKAAHLNRIVHRDLKPDNIFLLPRSSSEIPLVKVVDFGIAKLREENLGGITAPGELMGTPRYMSPEQCDGRVVDERSDVYSLGLIAFEMLTGRQAIDGNSISDIILGHTHKPAPDPHSVNPNVSAGLRQVILKALAKKPDDRFPDMGAFAQALQSPSDVKVVTPAAAPSDDVDDDVLVAGARRNKRVMAVVAGALTVGAAAFFLMPAKETPAAPVVAAPSPPPPPPAPEPPAPPPVQNAMKEPVKEMPVRKEAPVKQEAPVKRSPPPVRKEAPVKRETGRLSLQSKPWAKIIIDGKDTGKFTPVANLEVPAGTHTVELVNDKVRKRSVFKVTVKAGQRVVESRTLE